MKEILRPLAVAALTLTGLAAFAFLLFHQPDLTAQSPGPSVSAPTWKTNNLPVRWTTVTAAANSNVAGFGNSGAYTPGAAMRVPYQQPMGVYVSFSCATVTLANATCVLQFSPDSNVWNNLPGNTLTLSSGASASTANNTNVVLYTNLTAAQLTGVNWMRLASTTNGNAADLTTLRIITTTP